MCMEKIYFQNLYKLLTDYNLEYLEHVDSDTNFEQLTSQNIQTQLKPEKNTWDWLVLDSNKWTKLKLILKQAESIKASVFIMLQHVL